MAEKKKCPVCDRWQEVRKVRWGLIFKFHSVEIAGRTIECNGSGKRVK